MKSKITFIDILIVVFFLFAIIAAIFRINENISQKYRNLNRTELYDVVFDASIGADYLHSISIGDTVLDLDSEKFIGKVSDIKVYNDIEENSSDDENVSAKGYVNAAITVSSDYDILGEDGAFEDVTFVIGEKYNLALPGVAFEGVCISLDKRSVADINTVVRSGSDE